MNCCCRTNSLLIYTTHCSYTRRYFSFVSSTALNSLPSDVHSSQSLATFKRILKTHLFDIIFNEQRRQWRYVTSSTIQQIRRDLEKNQCKKLSEWPLLGLHGSQSEVRCCCVTATKQKCAEIKSSRPLVCRSMANFLRQNSKKKRGWLINWAKHLDRNMIIIITQTVSVSERVCMLEWHTYRCSYNDFCALLTCLTLLVQTAASVRTHHIDVVHLSKLLCLMINLSTPHTERHTSAVLHTV